MRENRKKETPPGGGGSFDQIGLWERGILHPTENQGMDDSNIMHYFTSSCATAVLLQDALSIQATIPNEHGGWYLNPGLWPMELLE